jgi:hypothetical protein
VEGGHGPVRESLPGSDAREGDNAEAVTIDASPAPAPGPLDSLEEHSQGPVQPGLLGVPDTDPLAQKGADPVATSPAEAGVVGQASERETPTGESAGVLATDESQPANSQDLAHRTESSEAKSCPDTRLIEPMTEEASHPVAARDHGGDSPAGGGDGATDVDAPLLTTTTPAPMGTSGQASSTAEVVSATEETGSTYRIESPPAPASFPPTDSAPTPDRRVASASMDAMVGEASAPLPLPARRHAQSDASTKPPPGAPLPPRRHAQSDASVKPPSGGSTRPLSARSPPRSEGEASEEATGGSASSARSFWLARASSSSKLPSPTGPAKPTPSPRSPPRGGANPSQPPSSVADPLHRESPEVARRSWEARVDKPSESPPAPSRRGLSPKGDKKPPMGRGAGTTSAPRPGTSGEGSAGSTPGSAVKTPPVPDSLSPEAALAGRQPLGFAPALTAVGDVTEEAVAAGEEGTPALASPSVPPPSSSPSCPPSPMPSASSAVTLTEGEEVHQPAPPDSPPFLSSLDLGGGPPNTTGPSKARPAEDGAEGAGGSHVTGRTDEALVNGPSLPAPTPEGSSQEAGSNEPLPELSSQAIPLETFAQWADGGPALVETRESVPMAHALTAADSCPEPLPEADKALDGEPPADGLTGSGAVPPREGAGLAVDDAPGLPTAPPEAGEGPSPPIALVAVPPDGRHRADSDKACEPGPPAQGESSLIIPLEAGAQEGASGPGPMGDTGSPRLDNINMLSGDAVVTPQEHHHREPHGRGEIEKGGAESSSGEAGAAASGATSSPLMDAHHAPAPPLAEDTYPAGGGPLPPQDNGGVSVAVTGWGPPVGKEGPVAKAAEHTEQLDAR